MSSRRSTRGSSRRSLRSSATFRAACRRSPQRPCRRRSRMRRSVGVRGLRGTACRRACICPTPRSIPRRTRIADARGSSGSSQHQPYPGASRALGFLGLHRWRHVQQARQCGRGARARAVAPHTPGQTSSTSSLAAFIEVQPLLRRGVPDSRRGRHLHARPSPWTLAFAGLLPLDPGFDPAETAITSAGDRRRAKVDACSRSNSPPKGDKTQIGLDTRNQA